MQTDSLYRIARTARRAGLAGLAGTTVEWYDFFIFGTASSLVFPKVFFPHASPAMGLLASFATFWIGFLGRPIGAVLFGRRGDQVGRRSSLVLTLMLMGSATTLIGLLPGYRTLGIAAPIMLCLLRLLQGIAVGGEWGGAVLLTAEHAPQGRRTTLTAWVQQGTPAGSLLAAVAFLPVAQLGDGAFLTWGWRIPFLLAAVLTTVGLVIRRRVPETPSFRELKHTTGVTEAPVSTLLRGHSRMVAVSAGAAAISIAGSYFASTFVLAWATTHNGFPRSAVLTVVLLDAGTRFLVQPLAALVASRCGAAKVAWAGIGLYLIATPINLVCLGTRSVVWTAVGVCFLALSSAVVYVVMGALLAEAFPVNIRYTGISVSQQLSALVFGGTAPMMAQALTATAHGALWPVAVYQGLLVGLSAVCLTPLARQRPTAETVPR